MKQSTKYLLWGTGAAGVLALVWWNSKKTAPPPLAQKLSSPPGSSKLSDPIVTPKPNLDGAKALFTPAMTRSMASSLPRSFGLNARRFMLAQPTAPTPTREPPANPFLDKNYNLDFAKMSEALTAESKKTMNERDGLIASAAGTAASIVALTGVGAPVAAVIALAGAAAVGVDRVISALKDDPNGENYAHDVAWWAQAWGKYGFLAALPGPDDSFKAIRENLQDGHLVFEDAPPFLHALGVHAGQLFIKWGGDSYALRSAAYFTVIPEGMTLGSRPPARDFDLSHNIPRLRLVAITIALEYGVQDSADQVYAAAQYAADQAKDIITPDVLSYNPDMAGAMQDGSWHLPVFAFLCGIHAAFGKAAELANAPRIPAITPENVLYATGRPDPNPFCTGEFAGLTKSQTLGQGGSMRSCDGRFVLAMQTDGNLVLYMGAKVLWQTNTRRGVRFTMQDDGNVVLYDGADNPLWNAGTQGHPDAYVALQNDGNLVVYGPSKEVLWNAGTNIS